VIQDVRCYAIRRLNPFLGVTQIVELGIGRALSTDAVNWEIQLAVERPAGWGSLNRGRSQRQFFRYGAWSEGDGLASFRVSPPLHPAALLESAETLVAAVQQCRGTLPFALADHFELWLLDARNEFPVALLAAVTDQHLTPMHRPAQWTAAPGGEHNQSGASTPAPDAGNAPWSSLESAVRRRAGSARRAIWFNRRCTSVPGSDDGFPELPVVEQWARVEDAAGVARYIAWLAPRLLTLPLAPTTRARLEVDAGAQPLLVDRLYPLYPEVLDRHRLSEVRVQARIMRAAD
jgi:hypothetical protein